MKERLGSIVPGMAATSGIDVVNNRVTSMTGALSGPNDSTLKTAMIEFVLAACEVDLLATERDAC